MTCDFSLQHYTDLLAAAVEGGYRWARFDHEPEGSDNSDAANTPLV